MSENLTFRIGIPCAFGAYELVDFIGRGGMAEIFLARTRTTLGSERLCVIKRILPHLTKDADFCNMLINEARLCANLSHVNVVKTYELGQIDDQYYIAMEYVEGLDLNRLLGLLTKSGIGLPLEFILFIIGDVLRGLDYAHRARNSGNEPLHIIHRDVSPTNVLISTEGEVKLCDFGIARAAMNDLKEPATAVEDSHIKGKFAYMSPEHAAGEEIDRRADLFVAGILLWEMLSGRRLYQSRDPEQTRTMALAAHIPDLENRAFPEFEMLEAIVRKALARDRTKRFSTGKEFFRAIEDYIHVTGLSVSQLAFGGFLRQNIGDYLVDQNCRRSDRLATQRQHNGLSPEPEGDELADCEMNRFTASLLQDNGSSFENAVTPIAESSTITPPVESKTGIPIAKEEGNSRWWTWIGIIVAIFLATALGLAWVLEIL